MESRSKFGEFARNAFLTLSLAACSSPQPLPEAKLWVVYDAPGMGKGIYPFSFSDKDKKIGYDYLEIKLKQDDEKPFAVIVGSEFVEPIYTQAARGVAGAIGTTSQSETPKPATAPSN